MPDPASGRPTTGVTHLSIPSSHLSSRPTTGASSVSGDDSDADTGMFAYSAAETTARSPAPPSTAYSSQFNGQARPYTAGSDAIALRTRMGPNGKRQLMESRGAESVLTEDSKEDSKAGSLSDGVSHFAVQPNGHPVYVDRDGRPRSLTGSEGVKMLAQLEAEEEAARGYDDWDDEEDSPYPEVQASVSNYDDPEMPVLTFRTWTLGILFACLLGGLNAFLYFRYPSPFLAPIIVQVLSYPCGKLLAYVLPDRVFRTPKFFRRLGAAEDWSFNPGPFNIKEHACIVIMANAAGSPAYGLSLSVVTEKFYGVPLGIGFDFLIVLTTQMIGFGVAGLCRRFLVWPASMIWPQNLVFCTLLNTLHAEDDQVDEGGGLSRYKFFVWATFGAFAYYFLPGFLFQALSAFSYVCWAAPNNVVVNQLFGVSSGLGMGILTFDWSQISYIGSPLVVPWWAEVNIFVGFVIAFWIIAPALYYSNVWYSGYLPISTTQVFDRFGAPYDIASVLDLQELHLNETAYAEYSPLYFPTAYTVLYGIAFALTSAVVVHTALYHSKEIWNRLRRFDQEPHDIHYKLMKVYPEVPELWYMIHLVVFCGLSIAVILSYNTQMPIWAWFLSVAIGFFYVLPGGYIYAMTAQELTINLVVEVISGYTLPGKPFANLIFKAYSLQSIGFALTFVQDLKLGHYLKVPPRATFRVQMVATLLSCLVQVGVKEWLVLVVPDLCDREQSARLNCPVAQVMFSGSITWGLVGPRRLFGTLGLYRPLIWCLFAGAILPVIFFTLTRFFPKQRWLKLVNIPVLLTGATWMPPATGINYSSWFLVGFLFQFLARRKFFRWWSKFNFILSASLDCGTVLSTVVIFLCLQLPKNGAINLDWWGNNVFLNTLDFGYNPYMQPPEEGFGPATWPV